MPTYYKIDSTRVSLAEWWRMGSVLGLVIGIVSKLTGWRMDFQGANAMVETLPVVEPNAVPDDAMEKLRPGLVEAATQGLQPVLFYSMPAVGQTVGFAASLVDKDGAFFGNAVYSRARAGAGMVTTGFGCLTIKNDNTWVSTCNLKKTLDSLPWSEDVYMPGASVTAVIQRHRDRIKALGPNQRKMIDAANLPVILREFENRPFMQRVQRKFYVLIDAAEVAALQEKFPPIP